MIELRIVCDNAYHDRGEGVCVHCVRDRIKAAVSKAEDPLRADVENLKQEIIELIIGRDKAVDSWKAENVKINFRADDYQQALIDALKALREHVCVKAIQGDGMNKVDYYPLEEGDCKLCYVFARLKNKVILDSTDKE